MNRHALKVLEFERVVELVAGRASSTLGAERVRALAPSDDLAASERELARVHGMAAIAAAEPGWNSYPIPSLGSSLARLHVEGTMLSGRELLDVMIVLRSSRLTADALRDPRRPTMAVALLASIRDRLGADARLEQAIERACDDEGNIRDDASPALRRLRRELRASEGELVALLERIMARLEPHQRVNDMSVTIRNGRYVIPVRREGRGAVGGIVHDTSGSGGTLFVEPPAAVDACNRIRELEADELREVDRILLELTDRLRPLGTMLGESLDALVELDALFARARFAADFGCRPVQLVPPGNGFRVVGGRHPLLTAQGIDVVPFNLEMSEDERTLLVSGPNTGGKTVLLKTLALLSLMAQSGIPAPVEMESRIVVYDDVFADVGDEQSIEASLSTFSAHVRNLAEILRSASDRSLVLIDELGSGTDPLEGAALGGAILEELTRRGAMTVATTHLGALKELALEVPGVVNASLQFDAVAVAPTYRLIKGIPGRSYGISIARRLALPEAVLQRAEERVPQVERDVNALLEALEAREKTLTRQEHDVEAALANVEARTERVSEREADLRERERALERESRRDARRYLLEARAEVEATIRELRRAASGEQDEVARVARQHVEQLAAAQGERLAELDAAPARRGTGRTAAPETPLAAGDWVEIESLGGRLGRLLEIRGDDCVVALGAVKMAFAPDDLTRASGQRIPDVRVPVLGDLPEVQVAREIDLRGMRAGELDEPLMQAIDAAVRADLRSLRIIHGKGTGALRERVAEMLRKDTRVKNFRLGAWNEGGAGVTVAEL